MALKSSPIGKSSSARRCVPHDSCLSCHFEQRCSARSNAAFPLSHALLHARQLLKRFAELLGDWARFARADGPAVALDDRNDLGGGAGQETFVGHEDIVARQGDFLDGALASAERIMGKQPRTAMAREDLARVLLARGKAAEGVKLLESALALRLESQGAEHGETRAAQQRLSVARSDKK
jgi:hypothetical protein